MKPVTEQIAQVATPAKPRLVSMVISSLFFGPSVVVTKVWFLINSSPQQVLLARGRDVSSCVKGGEFLII
jgi:hypothetical protein